MIDMILLAGRRLFQALNPDTRFGPAPHESANAVEARRMELSEREIRKAVAELRAMSDADLNDIGLGRGEIEYAVRYGRRDVDRRFRDAA